MAVELQPLSPRVAEATTAQGHVRADYYFVDAPANWPSSRNPELQAAMARSRLAAGEGFDLYSVYIYRKTGTLDHRFQGDAAALRGVHDGDLLAYARWNRSGQDIAYLIDHGQVVFDMLAGRPIEPPFEFD